MPILGTKFRTRIAIVDRETQYLEIDATVSETHTGSAQLTDHPVESSTDITDHIRRLPEELQITGIVSDTPIIALASLRATPSVPGTNPAARAEAAYQFLKDIKDQGRLVDVATKLRDYTSMAITSLSVTRDKDTANVLSFSLSLREIQIATTEVVTPPVPLDTEKKKKKNLGNKAKTETAPEPAKQSVLTRVFSLFGG